MLSGYYLACASQIRMLDLVCRYAWEHSGLAPGLVAHTSKIVYLDATPLPYCKANHKEREHLSMCYRLGGILARVDYLSLHRTLPALPLAFEEVFDLFAYNHEHVLLLLLVSLLVLLLKKASYCGTLPESLVGRFNEIEKDSVVRYFLVRLYTSSVLQ